MNKNEILNILDKSYHMNFTNVELLREGGCNTYYVWSHNDKYILKIIPSAFMDTAKQSLNILTYLERKEFPSPNILRTKDDNPYIEVNEDINRTIWVLFHFIDGREPDEGEDVEIIGELVGQLHSIMQDYTGNLPDHGKEFFIDRYISILKKKNYDEHKIEKFREYGDILWSRVEQLPRGFCHGDLHRGNLLKTPSGIYYLLDFDTSCKAFPIYDVMIICNSTNYFDYDETGYQKSKNTYKAFLKGYSKYCTLSENELNAFYDLIAIFHYQLQATIIEIHGLDCVDKEFLDKQLDWLMRWQEECERNRN